jgi:hypothetical protein
VIATTDPATLPEPSTWYLVTNLPAPAAAPGRPTALPPADLVAIVRLYGLRTWVEQSYKQVKGALGWNAYQVRGDQAIRRHLALVCGAFAFCWWVHGRDWSRPTATLAPLAAPPSAAQAAAPAATAGKIPPRRHRRCPARTCRGPSRCGRCGPGWSRGSCSHAIGGAGRRSPRPRRCKALLDWVGQGHPIALYDSS